jgi:RNA polymerase sigma factor (TIGR02999 family)
VSANDVTVILDRIADGDQAAAESLLPIVYEELRRMAGGAMNAQSPAHTLQPTALVHEAYLKLIGPDKAYRNRAHFMAVASLAMRQILTDHARRVRAARRGGDRRRIDVETQGLADERSDSIDAVALDDALTRLARLDPRRARVIELRFFGSLTVEEVASLLGVSRSTVEADWRAARAWLSAELAGA